MSEEMVQPQNPSDSSLEAPAKPIDSNLIEKEANRLRGKASRLRFVATFFLFMVSCLLVFGGYVFFTAGQITTRDVLATKDTRIREILSLQKKLIELNADKAKLIKDLEKEDTSEKDRITIQGLIGSTDLEIKYGQERLQSLQGER